MKTLTKFSLACTGILFVSFTIKTQQKDPWPVPDKYLKMANPVKSNGESINAGKELWVEHCQSCHGKKGMGDGTKAASLKQNLENFPWQILKISQTVLFSIKHQKGARICRVSKRKFPTSDDIWSLVNLIRTMKK